MNYFKQKELKEKNREFVGMIMFGTFIVSILIIVIGYLTIKWLPVLWNIFWTWVFLK